MDKGKHLFGVVETVSTNQWEEPKKTPIDHGKFVVPHKAVLHYLKIDYRFYMQALTFVKNFEIRHNDRKFREGQFIRLDEYDRDFGYTGRIPIFRKIEYITNYGQLTDYVVLGLSKVELEDPDFWELIKGHPDLFKTMKPTDNQ